VNTDQQVVGIHEALHESETPAQDIFNNFIEHTYGSTLPERIRDQLEHAFYAGFGAAGGIIAVRGQGIAMVEAARYVERDEARLAAKRAAAEQAGKV
jgi:hypothetical protein